MILRLEMILSVMSDGNNIINLMKKIKNCRKIILFVMLFAIEFSLLSLVTDFKKLAGLS